MPYKKRMHISWGYGKDKTYTKEFNDESHEQNWIKFMNKRGGVLHDEELVTEDKEV